VWGAENLSLFLLIHVLNFDFTGREHLFKFVVIKAQEILIARPSNAVEVNTMKAFMKALKIKYEVAKKSPYRPEFVSKIERSRKDYKVGKGETITVHDLEKLWK
jgi:hypothetical protein